LRAICPELELHGMFRAGSPQPLTVGYTRSLVNKNIYVQESKSIGDSPHGLNQKLNRRNLVIINQIKFLENKKKLDNPKNFFVNNSFI